jgi:hypothetical protein
MKSTVKIATLEEQMKTVTKKLDQVDRKIDEGFKDIKKDLNCYVRKEEFVTVRSIVYGMVGMILASFLSGVIYLVFK